MNNELKDIAKEIVRADPTIQIAIGNEIISIVKE
jgi:hypothetical protein